MEKVFHDLAAFARENAGGFIGAVMAITGAVATLGVAIYFAAKPAAALWRVLRGKNGDAFRERRDGQDRREEDEILAAWTQSVAFRELIDARAAHKAAGIIQEKVMPPMAVNEREIKSIQEAVANGVREIAALEGEVTAHRIEFGKFVGKQDQVNEHTQRALDRIDSAVTAILGKLP